MRSGARLALAVGAALCARVPALAQRADTYAARIDALVARQAAIRAELERQSITPAPVHVQMDTVRSGPIVMLAARSVRSESQWALDRATAIMAEKYGAVLGVIAQSPALLTVEPARDSGHGGLTLSHFLPGRGTRFIAGSIDSVVAAEYIVEELERKLRDHVPYQLTRWVGSVPLDSGTTAEWAAVRVRLVSQHFVPARECFESDIGRCKSMFGLVALPDSVPPDRMGARQAAALRRRSRTNAATLDMDRQCARDIENACMALARAAPWLGAPLDDQRITVTLLREALRVGGPGAVARMVAADGTVPEQLAVISGVSLDSLLTSWHHHIRTARHQNDTMSFEIALTSLLWAGLFGLAALRSSRWR
jgi:hypothetical protein